MPPTARTARQPVPKAMRPMAMFRRFSQSLSREWRFRHKQPHHNTITDFFGAMNAEL
jgi:hypothetical protein